MKVFKDIYLVGGGAYGYSHGSDCNVYALDGGSEIALIDTGCGLGVERIADNLTADGLDQRNVKIVILTHAHFDHIGGNKRAKELFGCALAAHELDAVSIESLDELTLAEMARSRSIMLESSKIDIVLKGGESISVGNKQVKAVHTPGHTPGGICVYFDIDGKRCLFSGDHVSTQGRLGFINGPGFNLDDWKCSLRTLLALRADAMFPGHGTFVISGASDQIKLYSDRMNSPWINITTSIG